MQENVKTLKVLKRDGTEDTFCENKIYDAIYEASKACGQTCDVETLTHKVISRLKTEIAPVEVIQDEVVHVLMVSKYKAVAEEYIKYRAARDQVREGKSPILDDISQFLEGTDETHIKENSNKSAEQIVSHRDLIAGILSKHMMKTILDEDVYTAHKKGAIHVHDGDYMISKGIHNCGVYDFPTMLANGVKLGDVEVETPKSVGTAANVACQIFSKISGSSYGGQSMHEFDQVMRPYVEKSLNKIKKVQEKYNLPEEYVEETLRKDIYDACQTFIYQIQTVTSNNGQSSFAAISLSLSTDPLCKMIKEEYLKCHTQGIGKDHKVPIFPKVLYFVEDGVNLNKGDENYDEFQLALKCSSKMLYPDYIMAPNNRTMTGDSENVITSMGCRSFVPKHIENGTEKTTGRFNLGVTTVNIPYAALEAKREGTVFYEELEKLCDLSFRANMTRIDRMKGTKAKVSPILWQYGGLASLEPEDTIDHLFYNGNATASIGYAGLYEALEVLGDTSKEKGLEVLQFIKDKTEEYTKETNISFSIYGSPLEGGCLRFANCLKKEFKDVWDFDRDYITNSFHQPVFSDIDIFDKFEWEKDFYLVSSGGNVNNIELPNMSNNLEGLEGVIKAAYDKVNYLICNQPCDRCFECGFEGEFEALEDGYHCPVCGNSNPETANCTRRVSGYIHDALARPANKGKYEEQGMRTKHM